MRGHACKGQLPAIEETRRSSAIMPNRDHCCVPQCQNSRAKNISNLAFHQFPSDESIQKQWIVKIRWDVGKSFQVSCSGYQGHCAHILNDLVHLQMTNSTRVCSVYLKEADFKTTLTGKPALEKYAVQSMFCWSRSPREKNLRKSENHCVRKCDYLIEACHRPLPLT